MYLRETGNWDRLLQWFHLGKHLPEQQNAKKLEGTKNNFTLSQLGANYKPAAISGVGANWGSCTQTCNLQQMFYLCLHCILTSALLSPSTGSQTVGHGWTTNAFTFTFISSSYFFLMHFRVSWRLQLTVSVSVFFFNCYSLHLHFAKLEDRPVVAVTKPPVLPEKRQRKIKHNVSSYFCFHFVVMARSLFLPWSGKSLKYFILF